MGLQIQSDTAVSDEFTDTGRYRAGYRVPVLREKDTKYVPVRGPEDTSWHSRNWSVYGQIHTAQKARLQHKTADKLVYCHEAMHLQQRMQNAGWKPDVERWESDEDKRTKPMHHACKSTADAAALL